VNYCPREGGLKPPTNARNTSTRSSPATRIFCVGIIEFRRLWNTISSLNRDGIAIDGSIPEGTVFIIIILLHYQNYGLM
jgi:hypothetical protein